MVGEPVPSNELVHTQVVWINDSLMLRFMNDDAVGSQQEIALLKKTRSVSESAQAEIDGAVGRRINGFMEKYFGKFGYGWRDVRTNVVTALKKRDTAMGVKKPHEAYVEEADRAVTNEIELPFYEMLSQSPVESLHHFQSISEQLYKQVGEIGLKSGRAPEAKKLVFFLEVIRDLQDGLEGAPARKQQYLQNLRHRIGQSLSQENEIGARDLLTGRILPVIDRKIEEFRQKATMMGSEYVVSPRSNHGAASRPIEQLLDRDRK